MKKLLLMLLLVLPWHGARAEAGAEASAATVIAMTGHVTYEDGDGTMKPVSLGQLFEAGDRLVTGDGSSLQLALADGSSLALGPNSELNVRSVGQGDKDSRSFFELIKGKVDALVRKLTLGAAFEIRTANACAAVKGTQFEVAFDSGNSGVTVLEGTVATSDAQRKATVMVAALHRSEVGAKGPSEPMALSEAESTQFRSRWAGARDIHARQAELLKGFEDTLTQRRSVLEGRRAALQKRLQAWNQQHGAAATPSSRPKTRASKPKKHGPPLAKHPE
jgi:hypothetical protein